MIRYYAQDTDVIQEAPRQYDQYQCGIFALRSCECSQRPGIKGHLKKPGNLIYTCTVVTGYS